MYLCKLWVMKHTKYYINSFMITDKLAYAEVSEWNISSLYTQEKAETETLAVIAACDWVYKEINK